ncbi:uncharacterized protein LOC122810662 [Protopterus annectens]|uniref:uncharacterized protein LOC122810662 n=1 Tax=Protopterus annectens TaxID=7888 RepID=UPI001CFB1742|nr:uncharacterized protein LOC122810662 [Protopterus annectens]
MLKRRKVTLITCTKVTVISPEGKKTSYSRVLKSQGSKRMAYKHNQQNSSRVQECLEYGLKASSSNETDTLKTIQPKSKHTKSSEISKSSHNGSSVKKEWPECGSSQSFLTSSERDAPKMMTHPVGVHTMSSADSMTAQQQTDKTELWSKNMDKSCLGEDASNLKRNYGRNSLQNLTPSSNHTILVEVTSVRENSQPRAFKKMTPDAWNANYVKMPFSDHSSYEKRSFMVRYVLFSLLVFCVPRYNKISIEDYFVESLRTEVCIRIMCGMHNKSWKMQMKPFRKRMSARC